MVVIKVTERTRAEFEDKELVETITGLLVDDLEDESDSDMVDHD